MPAYSAGPVARRNGACPPGFVPMSQVDPVLLDFMKSAPDFKKNVRGNYVMKWLVKWAEKKEATASKSGSRPLTVEDLAYYTCHPLLDQALALCGLPNCNEDCDDGCVHDLWRDSERPQTLGWYQGGYLYKDGCAAFVELDKYDQGYGALYDKFGPVVVHSAFEGIAVAQCKWYADRFDYIKAAVKAGEGSYAECTSDFADENPFPELPPRSEMIVSVSAPVAEKEVVAAVATAEPIAVAPTIAEPVVEAPIIVAAPAVATPAIVVAPVATVAVPVVAVTEVFTTVVKKKKAPSAKKLIPIAAPVVAAKKVAPAEVPIVKPTISAVEKSAPLMKAPAAVEPVVEDEEDTEEYKLVDSLFREFSVDKERYPGFFGLLIDELIEQRGQKGLNKYARGEVKDFAKSLTKDLPKLKNGRAAIAPPKSLTKTVLPNPKKPQLGCICPTFGPYSGDIAAAKDFIYNDRGFIALEGVDKEKKPWLNVKESRNKSGLGYDEFSDYKRGQEDAERELYVPPIKPVVRNFQFMNFVSAGVQAGTVQETPRIVEQPTAAAEVIATPMEIPVVEAVATPVAEVIAPPSVEAKKPEEPFVFNSIVEVANPKVTGKLRKLTQIKNKTSPVIQKKAAADSRLYITGKFDLPLELPPMYKVNLKGRKAAFYSTDPSLVYFHDKVNYITNTNIPAVDKCIESVNQHFKTEFNTVLIQKYDAGAQIPMHKDDEDCYDNDPILTYNLSGESVFSLSDARIGGRKEFHLTSGDYILLTASGSKLRHAVKAETTRVSLTFRIQRRQMAEFEKRKKVFDFFATQTKPATASVTLKFHTATAKVSKSEALTTPPKNEEKLKVRKPRLEDLIEDSMYGKIKSAIPVVESAQSIVAAVKAPKSIVCPLTPHNTPVSVVLECGLEKNGFCFIQGCYGCKIRKQVVEVVLCGLEKTGFCFISDCKTCKPITDDVVKPLLAEPIVVVEQVSQREVLPGPIFQVPLFWGPAASNETVDTKPLLETVPAPFIAEVAVPEVVVVPQTTLIPAPAKAAVPKPEGLETKASEAVASKSDESKTAPKSGIAVPNPKGVKATADKSVAVKPKSAKPKIKPAPKAKVVKAAKPFTIIAERAKFLGNQRAIFMKDGWYMVVHKSLYLAVRYKLTAIRKSWVDGNADTFYSSLQKSAAEFKEEKIAAKKEKRTSWIFSVKNAEKCFKNVKHWNYTARAAGLDGLYSKFREYMKSPEAIAVRPKLETIKVKTIKPKDTLPHFNLYKREISKKSLDQLVDHIDVLHENANLSGEQRTRLVNLVKQKIFLKSFFDGKLLNENKKLLVDKNNKVLLEKRMPQYGWDSLTIAEVNGNSMRDLKMRGKLNQRRVCVDCSKTLFLKEKSTKDGTFIYGKCSSLKCAQYCPPTEKKPCPKCEVPLDNRYRECIKCFRVAQRPPAVPKIKTKSVEAVRAHSTVPADFDLLDDDVLPFGGRFARVSWYKGDSSNVVPNVRTLHTGEGDCKKVDWLTDLPDIQCKYILPNLDRQRPIGVPISSSNIKTLFVSGRGWFRKECDGWLMSYEYYTFKCDTILVSGTPIFQDGRMISTVTYSDGNGNYIIMTAHPIATYKHAVGSLGGAESSDSFGMPKNLVEGEDFNLTCSFFKNSCLVFHQGKTYLLRYNFMNQLVTRMVLNTGNSWEVDTPHCLKPRQVGKKRAVPHWYFAIFLLSVQVSGGKPPLPLARLGSTTVAPASSPTLTTEVPTSTSTEGPSAEDFTATAGGKFWPWLSSKAPDSDILYWDRSTGRECAATLGNIRAIISKISHLDDVFTVKFRDEFTRGTLPTPVTLLQKVVNDMSNDINDARVKIGVNAYSEMAGGIPARLSELKNLKSKLSQWNSACKTLEVLTKTFTYKFDEPCLSNGGTISSLEDKATGYIKFLTDALATKNEDEEQLVSAGNSYTNALTSLKDLVISNSGDLPIPLFVVVKGNLGMLPVYGVDWIKSQYPILKEGTSFLQEKTAELSRFHNILLKYLSDDTAIDIPEDTASIWDLLTVSPTEVNLHDGTKAYLSKVRKNNAVVECYNSGSSSVCAIPKGGVIASDSNNPTIEKAVKTFRPVVTATNEETPPPPPPTVVEQKKDEDFRPIIYTSNVMGLVKASIVVIISVAAYETEGAAAAVAMLVLGFLLSVNACNPDLVMVQGTQNGAEGSWHAWGPIGTGQCVRFGDSVVMIDGIKVERNIEKLFVTANNYRGFTKSKYGCPGGLGRSVCDDKLGCESQDQVERSFCTNSYNGAFTKTDCLFPGELYTNVAVCITATGEAVHVYKLTGDLKVTVEYSIFRGGEKKSGTFIQGTQFMSGSEFSIMDIERKSPFDFDHVALQAGDSKRKPRFIEINKGVDVFKWCKTILTNGRWKFEDPNCLDITATQHGPDVEVQLPGMGIIKALSRGDAKNIISTVVGVSDDSRSVFRIVKWFNGHLLFNALPIVEVTRKCVLDSRPELRSSPIYKVYKHNQLEVLASETNCKIKIFAKQCHIHGTEVVNITNKRAITILICPYSVSDTITIEGNQSYTYKLSGLAVEYNYVFHALEDTVLRTVTNSSLLNVFHDLVDRIPNPIASFFNNIKKFIYVTTVVVCGLIGIIVGVNIMSRWQSYGAIFILVVTVSSGFLLASAEASEESSCFKNITGLPPKGGLDCDIVGAAHIFETVSGQFNLSMHDLLQYYCKEGAAHGYTATEFTKLLLSSCGHVTSGAHPGARPILSIGVLSFIGVNTSGVIQIGLYVLCGIIFTQYLYECVLIIRSFQRIVKSLFDVFRSDYERVAVICDMISSTTLVACLWQYIGWSSIFVVYTAQRPLIFEVARACAFNGRKVLNAYGHWWWSASIAKMWPKKKDVAMHQIVRGKYTAVSCPPEVASTSSLYEVEEHALSEISGDQLVYEHYRGKDFRNRQFVVDGVRQFYFHKIENVLVAPLHAIAIGRERWGFCGDLAFYPHTGDRILSRFKVGEFENSWVAIEGPIKTIKLVLWEGRCARIDRAWQKGDSGLAFYVNNSSRRLWMHYGSPSTHPKNSLNVFETWNPDCFVMHSGIENLVRGPIKEKQAESSTAEIQRGRSAASSRRSEFTAEKVLDVLESALLPGVTFGPIPGTAMQRGRSSSVVRKRESRDSSKALRSQSKSPSRRGSVVSHQFSISDIILAKARVGETTIKGQVAVRHHGVVSGRVLPEYEKIQTPAIVKRAPARRGNRSNSETAKFAKEIALEKEVKQNLIPKVVLDRMCSVVPDFKVQYWTNTNISREEYEVAKKEGKIFLQATTENFLRHSISKYDKETQERLYNAAASSVQNTAVGKSVGQLADLDYAKLAAVCDNIQFRKAGEVNIARARRQGKEVDVVNHKVITDSGSFGYKTVNLASKKDKGKEKEVESAIVEMASKKVRISSILDGLSEGSDGPFDVLDEEGNVVCRAIIVDGSLCIPAHSVIVDESTWYQANDLLVEHLEAFDTFVTQNEALFYNKAVDLEVQNRGERVGLRSNGLFIEDREFRKGDSGLTYETPQGKLVMFRGLVSGEDLKTTDVLNKSENVSIAEVEGDGVVHYYKVQQFPWRVAEHSPQVIRAPGTIMPPTSEPLGAIQEDEEGEDESDTDIGEIEEIEEADPQEMIAPPVYGADSLVGQSVSQLSDDDWAVFDEAMSLEVDDRRTQATKQLESKYAVETDTEIVEILLQFFEEVLTVKLKKHKGNPPLNMPSVFWTIFAMFDQNLIDSEKVRKYAKEHSLASLVNYIDAVSGREFCGIAHKGTSCKKYLATLQKQGGKTCLQTSLLQTNYISFVTENEDVTKSILLWILSAEFVPNVSPSGVHWNVGIYDPILKNILNGVATSVFCDLFSWHIERTTILPQAHLDVGGKLKMTPSAVNWAQAFLDNSTAAHSDIYNCFFPSAKKGKDTRVVIDRQGSWVRNDNIIQMAKFNGSTSGWGFIYQGILYSCYHVTRGRNIEVNVFTGEDGKSLRLITDPPTFTSSCLFKATEKRTTYRGDICVYATPGMNPTWQKPIVGEIYLLINPELHKFATLLCTGSSAGAAEITDSTQMVDHFAFVSITKEKLIEVVPFTDYTKGWSGLPIMSTRGACVGIFGFLRTLNTATPEGVVDRPESARPTVHTSQHDITSQVGEVLSQSRAAAVCNRWLRVSAPTGAGKSTRLVRAMGEELLKRLKKRTINIRVCVPTVFTVNNLFDGMCMMTAQDKTADKRVNILRHHGQLRKEDKLSFLSTQHAAAACINITYCTYGSYIKSCTKGTKPDLLILDEIHTRIPDVLAVETILKLHNRWSQVITMTATAWPASPTNDIFVDFSIGTSKRYPIEEKILKKWGEEGFGDENQYYRILGVDGKQYALPRDHCAADCKTLVFMATINQCKKAMDLLAQDNTGVGLMTLTSKNKTDRVPEGRVIIFCTEVAESGITIPNCDNVIDFRRCMRPNADCTFNPADGGSIQYMYTMLPTEINVCSATQRKGRTGRTNAGNYWTCDSHPLPAMHDRPPATVFEIALTMLKNEEITQMASNQEDWDDAVMEFVRFFRPMSLVQHRNLRPVTVNARGERTILSEEETVKVYEMKLEVMQSVNVLDPVAWYLLPNYPLSIVENGGDSAIAGNNVALVEMTKKIKAHLNSFAMSDSDWWENNKEKRLQFQIPIVAKMEDEQWVHSDESTRLKFRSECLTGVKLHSLGSLWWGGSEALLAIGATGFIFSQFYDVMYGTKKPVGLYQVHCAKIESFTQCYEYLTRAKLTMRQCTDVEYWVECLVGAVEASIRTVTGTLPASNKLRQWFDSNFPKVKTHSELNDIWARCLDYLEKAYADFQACLPKDRNALTQSWIGSGTLAMFGTFYDQWVAELSPFGAFLFAIGIGGIAATVVCTSQFVGACLIGGFGYLLAHWWNKPKQPNKYLAMSKDYYPKNRILQFEIGAILGNLVTHYFVPMVSEHQDVVYEKVMKTMNRLGKEKVVAVAASANATTFTTLFTQSSTSRVYDMYIQLGQLWSGKIDIYSAEGLSAVLTSYGGVSSIFSLDVGSLLTLATVAGVDWLCSMADKNIEQTWFRQYGTLKPGGKLEEAFFAGSELEKTDRMSTIRRVQSTLHCIVASGFNPVAVLPALIVTLSKKVYEGETAISGGELLDTYMRAVTTHPFVLLINIVWNVWSKLKESSEANVGVKLNSEGGAIAWLLQFKDRISAAVRESCEALWAYCKKNTRTLRRAKNTFCFGVRILYNVAGWIGKLLISKMGDMVTSLTDAVARSIVKQVVPTFWLKYVAKRAAPLKATSEDIPSDLTRFFHLYGMGSLLTHCQSLLTNRHFSNASCVWEIQSMTDYKLWRTLQRVAMRSNLSEISQILSSFRINSNDPSGWFLTDRPVDIQKYLVSCLAFQLSLDVETFVNDEIEDQCINKNIHFSLFWNEKFTLTIVRSSDLRSVFLLLTNGVRGAIFSWKWDIPDDILSACKPYRPDYVVYQKEMVETITTNKRDWAGIGLTQTKYPQLVDVGWDDIMHDLAFSQSKIPDLEKLLYVALNVTPLDAELAKLKNHDQRLDRVISDFSLEKLGVFKGIERTWGWRAGFNEEFISTTTDGVVLDPKAKCISHADLRHYGVLPGFAQFACRVEPLDFGVSDILAWTHVVTGLPVVRNELGKCRWRVCSELSSLSKGSPFIEVCNWGFKLHFLPKSMQGRSLKQLPTAINSLRVFKNDSSWHEALNDTRKRDSFITDVAKYNVNPSRYFTCLRTDTPYIRDYKLTDKCQDTHNKLEVRESTISFVKREYPRCVSEHILTHSISGAKETIAQVHGKTAEGKDLFISLRFMCNAGVVVGMMLKDVKLIIPSTEQISPADVAKLIVNGCALQYTDTVVLNTESRTWFYVYTAYGEILSALGPNVNPWVTVHIDPSRDVFVDDLFVDRNPDWVFTAMLGSREATEESADAHANIIKHSIQGYLDDLDALSTGQFDLAKVSIIDEDQIHSHHFNAVCDGSYHSTLVSQNPEGVWSTGYEKCRTQIKGIDTRGDIMHQINLETVKDCFSTRKINIKATSVQPEGPKNDFLRAMAVSQSISGRQPVIPGKLDDRDLSDPKLAVELSKAQFFGKKINIAKGKLERVYHVAGTGTDVVFNTARKLSTLFSAKRPSAKTHGVRNFFQIVVDALNPNADFRKDAIKSGRTNRDMKVEMEYMAMLAEYQKSLDPIQGETSATISEAYMREQTLREIVENLKMPASDDIERIGIESGGIVHFSDVSKRSLPDIPFVGSAFAGVEISQEKSKSTAFVIEELTSYRKTEVLPQGCAIVPIQRKTKIPNNGQISMSDLSAALARVKHIKQPFWDAMTSYNRVYKPRNTELDTASRGWPKCQIMDRDLGLWSSASVYFDMTAGFGGFSEYYTHCPPLVKVVNGEVVEKLGHSRVLVFNSLIQPGHAAPVVDKIVNPDNPKVTVRMLNPVDGHGTNGDIRDSRLLELVREVSKTYPPQLMSFDAGEASANLTAEASWQTRELPMTPDLESYAFTKTFAGAVELYLPLVAPGGSAVIKMMGFTSTTVDLIQRYSKGFSSLICYKNPTTSLASREWYLVLLGRQTKFDKHTQLCMDECGRTSDVLPSVFGETLESDTKKVRYFMGVNHILRQEKFEDFRYGAIVMNMRIEWYRAFNRFADWARHNYSHIQSDLTKYGNQNHSLGEGLIITATGQSVDSVRWENELAETRRGTMLTLDNAIKKLGYTRRFNTPKYYTSFMTPRGDWVNSKATLSPTALSAMTLKRQLAEGNANLDVPSFTIFGETFEPRMPTRVQMLRTTAIASGYKITSPSGLFTNVREPFRITFKEVFGKEKHVQNMILGDMAMHVFGMTQYNSVIGHTQCTEEFLHSAWDKRLNIAMKEPSAGDAQLLYESMRAIRTPECMEIVNGPENNKFKPWTYEEACAEVHKQGKGGHFDRYLDFAAAISDPEFEKSVLDRLHLFASGMAAPTYQVCRDKRETKAKKCIDGTGRLTITREPGEKEEDFQQRLKKTSSIAPRNIRFAEFTQRMADLMLLGPVQKHHAHVEKLYYGSSTGTPLWRLGNLTKALHDVYAPEHQQEFWDSSELRNHIDGDSATQQSWFQTLMEGKGKQLKDDVYIRMYDPSFRKGMERKIVKTLIASGDFSGFDGTVSKTDMVLNYLFYKDVYQSPYHLTLKTRWEHWLWALVITDHGNVIISDGQRSSGDQDTSFGNTMINSIYHYRSTALALGISINDSTRPIGEVWFRSDFNYEKPKFKKVYLHRITHISDGDDNLHFGTEADIRLFDANGPAFLERCGKKIRCGTRSGYQISEGYSGLSYCSHSYVRTRIGHLAIDRGAGPVMTPIDVTPFGQRKVNYDSLPQQHQKDVGLGLRVQYLPMRPIPEIIGKLVYTLKSSTVAMDLVRDYGPSTKETKRGIKNEDAISITRGKLLSYMLNYAHINVVRILCMSALSVIGDGVCNLKELKRRFHTPSAVSSLASGLKGVFNVNALQEIESLSPTQEKDGLRAMRHNTMLQFRTCNLRRYGSVAPLSMTMLHQRCESWIQDFCIRNDVLPDWTFWKIADPNFVYANDIDLEHLDAETLPRPPKVLFRERFMTNLMSFFTLLSIALPSRVAEKASRSDEFVRNCLADPETYTQYDVVVELPADVGHIPKNIRLLYPNLKSAAKEHVAAMGGPNKAIGHSFTLEGAKQKVYVVVVRKTIKHSPSESDVARALNDAGFNHEMPPNGGPKIMNRRLFRSNPPRPLVVLAPNGRLCGRNAELCIKTSCSRSIRKSLIISI
uniref:Genome polyprotein n=1 Tax=Coptis virus 1 TaxID=3014456 RepID=A0A9N6YJR0_9FLAV|nr:TPA_asm: polyprotein [Coptis virus 1]